MPPFWQFSESLQPLEVRATVASLVQCSGHLSQMAFWDKCGAAISVYRIF